MTYEHAMARADALRPNTIKDEQKARWLHGLDCDFAETMERAEPAFPWPDTTAELLVPAPRDEVYVLYLCAMLDYHNEETAQYANDYAVFNEAYDAAKAWYRRNHRTRRPNGNWRVMG